MGIGAGGQDWGGYSSISVSERKLQERIKSQNVENDGRKKNAGEKWP